MSGLAPAGRRATGRAELDVDADSLLGMSILLGAWVMLFAALFFAYGVVRAQSSEWPPFAAPRLPRVAPGLNTLLLLGSSATLRRGLVAARRRGEGAISGAALVVTLVLGVGFLAAQIALWTMMRARGLFPGSGIYGSVFFAFTGFHALHVLGGLVALAAIGINAVLHRNDAVGSLRAVRLTALYWDFIAIIWVLMYLAIYLL